MFPHVEGRARWNANLSAVGRRFPPCVTPCTPVNRESIGTLHDQRNPGKHAASPEKLIHHESKLE